MERMGPTALVADPPARKDIEAKGIHRCLNNIVPFICGSEAAQKRTVRDRQGVTLLLVSMDKRNTLGGSQAFQKGGFRHSSISESWAIRSSSRRTSLIEKYQDAAGPASWRG